MNKNKNEEIIKENIIKNIIDYKKLLMIAIKLLMIVIMIIKLLMIVTFCCMLVSFNLFPIIHFRIFIIVKA